MNQPWFKFYPTDWRADPKLRMCSIAARGLWIEMLCIMHEAEPRGSLLINGAAVNAQQIAALAGIPVSESKRLIAELQTAGVCAVEDDVIISRRMRADTEKAARDKANGRKGGNPTVKAGVNPPDNGEDKAQKPEARSQRPPSGSDEPEVSRAPAKPSPRAILETILDASRAAAIIDHRQRKRAPLGLRAAELLAGKLAQFADPNAAADLMIVKGWQSIETDWAERNGLKLAAPVDGSNIIAMEFITRDDVRWPDLESAYREQTGNKPYVSYSSKHGTEGHWFQADFLKKFEREKAA